MFIFMILRPLPPHGLFVSIGNREFLSGEKSPWPETLAVYVRKPSRFFVNGEEVERSSLRAKLLDHLSRRAPWTVYFEADSDTTYMDAVYAIDTIQGCGRSSSGSPRECVKNGITKSNLPNVSNEHDSCLRLTSCSGKLPGSQPFPHAPPVGSTGHLPAMEVRNWAHSVLLARGVCRPTFL